MPFVREKLRLTFFPIETSIHGYIKLVLGCVKIASRFVINTGENKQATAISSKQSVD